MLHVIMDGRTDKVMVNLWFQGGVQIKNLNNS